MKNQYFGDVNDYLKYGLLRILSGWGRREIAVCWMLTPDDGRSDGQFIGYLEQPERWRRYDPALFDALRRNVNERSQRGIRLAETGDVLPATRFFGRIVPEDSDARRRYFVDFWHTAAGCELVFFDPDNGMEVRSTPYGRRNSVKYLYWRELQEAIRRGHTALVYQHFPRVKRDDFVTGLVRAMREKAGAGAVATFHTPRVIFFLLGDGADGFAAEAQQLARTWEDQIRVEHHPL